jgi:hypothetical protein
MLTRAKANARKALAFHPNIAFHGPTSLHVAVG